jgi:hypothetical protein
MRAGGCATVAMAISIIDNRISVRFISFFSLVGKLFFFFKKLSS